MSLVLNRNGEQKANHPAKLGGKETMKKIMAILVCLSILVVNASEVMAAPLPAGSNPASAIPLDHGLNEGALEPGTEVWYKFNLPKRGDTTVGYMNLTLIHVPGEGNIANRVGFEIYTTEQLGFRAAGDRFVNTGAAETVSRDGNANTGEHIWAGDLMRGIDYYLRVRNDSGAGIAYKLFDADIIHVAFGPVQLPETGAAAAPAGSNPTVPLQLDNVNANASRLDPGEERWYTYTPPTTGTGWTDHVNMTLVNIPAGWQVTDRVQLQIFTGDKLALWARGDKLVNTGAGEIVERDGDRNTGEHIWAGDMMKGAKYYIQVRNESATPISYKLYTKDFIHEEKMEAQSAAAPAAAPGSSPAAALKLEDGVNEGLLKAGSEKWYTVVRPKKADSWTEYMALTLVHAPGGWMITDNIGFQVFTGDKLALWARGDKLVNTGAGTTYERDGDPNTGEHLWAGDLMRGEVYYIQLFNNSASDVGYKLYTKDVIHSLFGPPPAVVKEAPAAPGSNPAVALKLAAEEYTSGTLGPDQSYWYLFNRPKLSAEPTEYMALTLIHMPGGWKVTDNVGFQIFTADKLALWLRGDKLENTGAGTTYERDGNPNTGEHLWAGYVMRGLDYYLQVFNNSQVSIDYRLYQGDVIHSDIGK
jgi:hypothetical protein